MLIHTDKGIFQKAIFSRFSLIICRYHFTLDTGFSMEIEFFHFLRKTTIFCSFKITILLHFRYTSLKNENILIGVIEQKWRITMPVKINHELERIVIQSR